jgi:twitching motility two-component system response regulator PilH
MSILESKTALVVDDELAQREFVSAILDDHKMKAICACNGLEAMEKILETKPDVILLDLLMPEEGGMTFFNRIKKKEEFQNIPVIVISGSSQITGVDVKSMMFDKNLADRKKKVLGIDAAPDAYLEKPVDPQKLVETIEGFLARS